MHFLYILSMTLTVIPIFCCQSSFSVSFYQVFSCKVNQRAEKIGSVTLYRSQQIFSHIEMISRERNDLMAMKNWWQNQLQQNQDHLGHNQNSMTEYLTQLPKIMQQSDKGLKSVWCQKMAQSTFYVFGNDLFFFARKMWIKYENSTFFILEFFHHRLDFAHCSIHDSIQLRCGGQSFHLKGPWFEAQILRPLFSMELMKYSSG